MAVAAHRLCRGIGDQHGCQTEIEQMWRSQAIYFDKECIEAVRSAAIELV